MNLTELQPSVSLLSGGLDLATPKNVASPGSLVECMNVEVAESIGYKSIDGIVKHDGRFDAASFQEGELTILYSETNISPLVVPGTVLFSGGEVWAVVVARTPSPSGSSRTGEYLGVFVKGSQNIAPCNEFSTQFDVRESEEDPDGPVIATITAWVSTPSLFVNNGSPTPPARETISVHNALYNYISNRTNPLPGDRRAHGLHWFKDRLYAVANKEQFEFESSSGGGSGQSPITPGMLILPAVGGYLTEPLRIGDLEVAGGEWGSGASGTLWMETMRGQFDSFPPDGTQWSVVEWDEEEEEWRFIKVYPNLFLSRTTPIDRSERACLWRTTEEEFVELGTQEPDKPGEHYGWNRVDMGWEIGFENGNYPAENLPSVNRRSLDSDTSNEPLLVETGIDGTDGSGTVLTNPGDYGAIPPFTDQYVGTSTLTGDVEDIEESGDNNFLELEYKAIAAGGGTLPLGRHRRGMHAPLALTNFYSNLYSQIPDDVVIRGIEVQVKTFMEVDEQESIDNDSIIAMRIKKAGAWGDKEVESKEMMIPREALSEESMATLVFGGIGDLWGVDDITKDDILDSNFGIDFQFVTDFFRPNNQPSFGIERTIKVDSIKLIVHYVNPTAKVYFWDGTSDVSAQIGASHLVDGEFKKGTAEGVLHLYNIESVSGGGKDYVAVGDEMYLLPNGEGKKVLDVVDFSRAAYLPSLDAIVEKNSRYQFRTYNYYANEDWEAMYGVSGAGRAFTYDGMYFRYIYTGLDDDLDMPRHIETHLDHLCLGYSSGSVFISVAGDPEDFSGLRGAFEVATGDRVTGLLSLPGTMLGIGCRGSMWGLAGDGVQSFSLQALRPKEGCIEYTFEDCGMPVYCSNTGITVFSATPSYGDFSSQRLSYNVYPFLFNRTRNSQSSSYIGNNKGIICAIPIRKKGQYILFFRDGYALCCSLGDGQSASFTHRRYSVLSDVSVPVPSPAGDLYWNQNPYTNLTPIAHTVQVDGLGRERAFFSHYNTGGGPSNTLNSNLRYVFEIDRGWSMSGNWFPWWFRTNFDFAQDLGRSPSAKKVSRGIKLYGMSHGWSALSASVENSYKSPTGTKNYYDVSLPRLPGPGEPEQENYQPEMKDFYSNTAIVAKEGEFFTFTVRNLSPKYNNNERAIGPPVVCQVILKEYDGAREGA